MSIWHTCTKHVDRPALVARSAFCFERSAQVIRLMNEANTLQEAGNFDGSNAAVEKVRQVGAENTDA